MPPVALAQIGLHMSWSISWVKPPVPDGSFCPVKFVVSVQNPVPAGADSPPHTLFSQVT